MYHSTRVEVGGQLSGITMQVLGTKLKSSDWVASALSLSRLVGSVEVGRLLLYSQVDLELKESSSQVLRL